MKRKNAGLLPSPANLKTVKPPEKIHPRTLIVASLTAITLAFISAKLTNLVNSLVLVAMASVLTALISEFYRVTIERTQKAIAKAVAKNVERRLGELDVSTTAEEIEEEQEAEIEEEAVVNSSRPVRQYRLRKVLASRWAVPIVFSIVAIVTILGSYSLGHLTSEPAPAVVRNVFETKDISGSTADAIEQSAADEAQRKANAAKQQATNLIGLTREELMQRIEDLEKSAKSADDENKNLDSDVKELKSQTQLLQQQLADIQRQMKDLEQQDTPVDPAVPEASPASPQVP